MTSSLTRPNFKVIIAGSRNFNDFNKLWEVCDYVLSNIRHSHNIRIVSGCARGADKLGECYAEMRRYPIDRYPADWDRYGKSAGYIRNSQMADYADALIAFWDGKSKGTKHMIDLAQSKGLKVRLYMV